MPVNFADGGWLPLGATTTGGTLYVAPVNTTTSIPVEVMNGNGGTEWWQDPPLVAIRQREQRDAEFHRQRRERLQREREAAAKAHELLLSLLDAENRERYERERYFIVHGSAGGRYRINQGYMGNIRRLEAGGIRGNYCAHPRMNRHGRTGEYLGSLPYEDAMIAQMFAIMTDEEAFLRVANRV